jgi:hypothetical protein
MTKRLRRPGSRFGLALHVDAFVFFHRVEEEARNGISSTSTILGHIMAHELGHLVLGESSHSSEGIMTETLRKKHFEQANKGKLLFLAEEAQRMRVRWGEHLTIDPLPSRAPGTQKHRLRTAKTATASGTGTLDRR